MAADEFFEVALVGNSPFYEPGNELTMPSSVSLRVTNKDPTEGRPARSFRADDGTFDSGPLKSGQQWTYTFDGPGKYQIKDMAAGFIYATLIVT